MNNYVEEIEKKAKTLGDDVYTVCKDVLEDKRFSLWSGSSKDYQHHYGAGGLIEHTCEVITLCFKVKSCYEHIYNIDSKELFLSAFFHDVGKMWDYEPVVGANGVDYREWTSSKHKRMIHHISRSALVWGENAEKNQGIYDAYFEKVLHAILAHHTFREFGSPVAPKSRIAWMVTLCDNISARMYDADTLDILDRKK